MLNIFNWRPFETAPKDGTPIVDLNVITYVGGWSRPIDIDPQVSAIYWKRFREDVDVGYWSRWCPDFPNHEGSCQNVSPRTFWTTLAEYKAAADSLESWAVCDEQYDYWRMTAVVFVRPTEHTYARDLKRPNLEATTAWNGNSNGTVTNPDNRWQTVRGCSAPGSYCAVEYLNGGNTGDKPFRWCTLAEFFPPQVFDHAIESETNSHKYRLERLEKLREVTRG